MKSQITLASAGTSIMLTIFEVYGLNFLNFWKYLYSPHSHRLLPYGHRAAPVRLILHRTETLMRRTVSVRAPCGSFTSAVWRNPGISYGRRTASRDMWPRRLRSPWNRTMFNKNENRTISLVTKLSYGARSICDWGFAGEHRHCWGLFDAEVYRSTSKIGNNLRFGENRVEM